MTKPVQRRFGRRALVVGAGALAAYQALKMTASGADAQLPGAAGAPLEGSGYRGTQQTADLTVRWRHLERRVKAADLLAAWHFDEGSGYAFDDVSGHGHTLFLTGANWNTTDSGLAAAIHGRGFRGGAVHLDGTRWLAAGPTADLSVRSGLTVTCWVRPDVLPTQPALLVGFGVAYALTLDPTGTITLTMADASGGRHVVHSSDALSPGRWSQVTATASPKTGAMDLYVDGVLAAKARARRFAMRRAVASLVLGDRFTGDLDEVTIHQAALAPAEIRRLYVVGLPKVYTQTSESIDAGRQVFTRFKGSEPIPHPLTAGTALSLRFAGSFHAEDGAGPIVQPASSTLEPGAFGGAWRATGDHLTFRSPLSGDSGSFEAWYQPITDLDDAHRTHRKEIFAATGTTSALTLYTRGGRWCFDVRRTNGRTETRSAFAQQLAPMSLEHVAVTWGQQPTGGHGVVLYVNGVPAAALTTAAGETSSQLMAFGGTTAAPAYCLLDDVRISDRALAWGEVCPRGQASTEAAGLDLRDSFERPPGAAPMLWRVGSADAAWSHRRLPWQDADPASDDPTGRGALFQGSPAGLHPIYHPDAFGHASSIEAGVAFPSVSDGWAGLFVQAPDVVGLFSGVTFMLNPARREMRLARYVGGRVAAEKALPYDFPITARTTYEMTLTCADDGIVRGFTDGTNVISMRAGAGWPREGYAGMVTENARADFTNLHFCALTPATAESRVIRTRILRYGDGAALAHLALVPFRWHRRRGLLPWQYTSKDPEPAGNIAGADTAVPLRPIPPAAWRSEDSANSDLITVDGRIHYFMRGNPRIDNDPSKARIGALYTDVAAFDGIHFIDPNAASAEVRGGTILQSGPPTGVAGKPGIGTVQVNAPSTAYVGDGRLLFFGRQSSFENTATDTYGELVFSRFDVRTASWEHDVAQQLTWARPPGSTTGGELIQGQLLRGSPEVVSLRNPDDDSYEAVVFQQTGRAGHAEMATALLVNASAGQPTPAPGLPVFTSLSRAGGGAIYGFRVMYDNGIYYLHYNDGPQVPDWPDRFVLAAALHPYTGPWATNVETAQADSLYFRRGGELEPDNGAIWQGTMFKHRGQYYMYYENYHSVGDVDQAYADYTN
ncbi:MAG: hypothetical protein QOI51_756, partial [Nocardioidaceae bacterium]|nr:hypothetical protein [Nocardioidaceae bacterium]